MNNEWKEPIFFPWIGEKYLQMPVKVLVVGDSGYCGDEYCQKRCGVRGNCTYEEMGDCRNFTKNIIKGYIDNRLKDNSLEIYEKKTYLGFESSFLGYIESETSPTSDKSNEFWNSIVFYNYVQTAIASTSDQKEYNNTDYAESAPMFLHLINEINPNYIFIWGRRAFYAAPIYGWIDDEQKSFQGKYKLENGKIAKCASIHHPSRGYRVESHNKIKQLMGEDYNLFLKELHYKDK